jgi:lipopolysaccharide/colanic/teichoic acid biosynthesis glycosyltransferase
MTQPALRLPPSSAQWPAPPRGVSAPVATDRVPAWEEPVRAALDLVGASLALVVLLPLLLVAALWVRLDSRGPAMLRQSRIGRGGQPFTCYKFRTMQVDCDDHLHRALIEAELTGNTTLHEGSTKVPP